MTYYAGPDLARAFRTVRKNTIQIAQEIPEDQYGYRAAPDTRTVAETLAHLVARPSFHHALHGRDKKTFFAFDDFAGYMSDVAALENGLKGKSKAELIAALEREGETFAKWLDSLSSDDLGQTVGFPPPLDPPQKTRFEMLLSAKEHEMHHRGQLMLIERLLGIVPHLTRAWQERTAAAAR